jgi:carbonic anhydrase/acetyltransferase-like protein (isoleucine patch superfamily)
VAPFAELLAGPGGLLLIGNGSDVQDNVTIDARKGSVVIGDQVPVAHGTTIIGPATIGASAAAGLLPTAGGVTYDTFISFNAWVENATLEPGSFVNGLAKVKGVTLPAGVQVLPGKVVQSPADLNDPTKVQPITSALETFEVAVLDVNHNFALGYTSLFDISRSSIFGVGFDPSDTVDPTNPGAVVPIIGGIPVARPTFRDRIIGRVIIENNTIGQLNRILGDMDSIRGDEGHPITINSFARVKDRVTFHSLDGTQVQVGRNASIGYHCVIHGGVNQVTGDKFAQIGDNFVMGDYAVIYRSTIGNNVKIGEKCYIDSSQVPSGTTIPPRTILVKNVITGTVDW